ncbi:amino acid ABC transporter permease [Pseudomonas aeruginosa]|uniref:amino acid ABC transporter permease n=2 Tax=Pseudomonas aeruginosa TaxID=287 RepID=UPI001495AE45|nr:amino acid ABC transporter permease [Pseudomonas aeruginosa]NPS70522.1 amino acid ABC transporter permease [Pseudomonas aeruginosa]
MKALLATSRPASRVPWGRLTIALPLTLGTGLLIWHYRDPLQLLVQWTPLLLGGAAMNLLMGVVAMLLASLVGCVLGILQLAPGIGGRLAAVIVRGLRSLPWLVVMFYAAYLLPYELHVAGRWLQLPDWLKASAGLALPVCGYVAEFVRGALLAIPANQWDAAAALSLSRFQRLRWVILPQAVRGLLAPAMNLFCTLLMATSLANLLGVEELLTRLQMLLNSQTRPDLLLPAYLYAFLAFFICVYPLSRYARRLERRWSQPR